MIGLLPMIPPAVFGAGLSIIGLVTKQMTIKSRLALGLYVLFGALIVCG